MKMVVPKDVERIKYGKTFIIVDKDGTVDVPEYVAISLARVGCTMADGSKLKGDDVRAAIEAVAQTRDVDMHYMVLAGGEEHSRKIQALAIHERLGDPKVTLLKE